MDDIARDAARWRWVRQLCTDEFEDLAKLAYNPTAIDGAADLALSTINAGDGPVQSGAGEATTRPPQGEPEPAPNSAKGGG